MVFIIGTGASSVIELGGVLGVLSHMVAEVHLILVAFQFLVNYFPWIIHFRAYRSNSWVSFFNYCLGALDMFFLAIMRVLLVYLILVHILTVLNFLQDILDRFHFCGHSRVFWLEYQIWLFIWLNYFWYSSKGLVCVLHTLLFSMHMVDFLDMVNHLYIIWRAGDFKGLLDFAPCTLEKYLKIFKCFLVFIYSWPFADILVKNCVVHE